MAESIYTLSPNFLSGKWYFHQNAKPESEKKLVLNATAGDQFSRTTVMLEPKKKYLISAKITGAGRIRISRNTTTSLIGGSWLGDYKYTDTVIEFTVPEDTGGEIVFSFGQMPGVGAGTYILEDFTVKDPALSDEKTVMNSLKLNWTAEDFYNFYDLNRVERATQIVRNKLALDKGESYNQEYVFNRVASHIEYAHSFNRIEKNIQELATSFKNSDKILPLKTDWTFNQPFDFNDANRYEQNLSFMYENIEANLNNLPYCGQYIVGQEGVY